MFKVGDKARVIVVHSYHNFKVGDVLTILGENGRGWYLAGLDGNYHSINENEIKLIERSKRFQHDEVDLIESEDMKEHGHYNKSILGKDGIKTTVDVYRVLEAFNVTNPQLQHIVKKALCAGQRGHKDYLRDLQDIVDSAKNAIEMEKQKGEE